MTQIADMIRMAMMAVIVGMIQIAHMTQIVDMIQIAMRGPIGGRTTI